MNVNLNTMVDGLTNLVMVIKNDGKLLRWFDGLLGKPVDVRRNEIYAMSSRFYSNEAAENIMAAFKMLAVPAVFEAAHAAVHDGHHPAW